MTKQPTELAKAIKEIEERIEQYRKEYKQHGTNYYKGKITSAVHFRNYLKSLLPTEREQMEECYISGYVDSSDGCGLSETDYFTENYTQDGK